MDITKLQPVYLLLLALACASAMTGCNTIEGAGQDIQRGGEAIEDAADENK
jgi:predicted small secreted protein